MGVIVRVGYLRMVSVSASAMAAPPMIEHIVREADDRREVDGRRRHRGVSAISDAWPVTAVCGATFLGMARIGRYDSFRDAPYPQLRSGRPARPCANCEKSRYGGTIRYDVQIRSTATWENQIRRVLPGPQHADVMF